MKRITSAMTDAMGDRVQSFTVDCLVLLVLARMTPYSILVSIVSLRYGVTLTETRCKTFFQPRQLGNNSRAQFDSFDRTSKGIVPLFAALPDTPYPFFIRLELDSIRFRPRDEGGLGLSLSRRSHRSSPLSGPSDRECGKFARSRKAQS